VTKIAVSYRLSDLTLRQLEELSERWGMNKTETLSVVVDRAYRQEGEMKEFNLSDVRVRANVPEEGFDLKSASREIRRAAAWAGIRSGRWAPVNAGVAVDTLADDEIIAVVWNTRRGPVDITAADIRLALEA
jgi:hypothetical protein